MGIRLDQAVALRLSESPGQASEQAAPRRPASVPSVTFTIDIPSIAVPAAPSGADLRAAVAEINRNLQNLQTSLAIVHDKASGRTAAVVRDSSGEVIRQIPPEAVLHAVSQVRRIVGLLLDETV